MMLNTKALPLALLCMLPLQAAQAGNYNLTINGTTFELDLGTEEKLKLPNGQELVLQLDRKTTSVFAANGASFEHPSEFNVATSRISPGIHQHLLATALGTLILVQTYADMDATTLVDLMTGKMTDDDAASGYTRETKSHSRTLADGSILAGTRTTLKRVNDDAVVEVLGARIGRGGVMLITRTDRNTASEEGTIIEHFWSTLKLHK